MPPPLAVPAPPDVLHFVLSGLDLLVWGERPPTGRPPAPPARPGNSQAALHPRHFPPEALRAALQAADLRPVAPAGSAPQAATLAERVQSVSLPTSAGLPLPSPAAGGDPSAQARLETWTVAGLLVDPSAAAAWMRPFYSASGRLRLGPEWTVLWRAAAVVRGAVARGAVAPEVAQLGYGRAPGWRLVRSRAEHRALADVARSLPRAALPARTEAATAMEAVLRQYAGRLIRAAAGGSRALTPLRRVPRGMAATPGRRWLAALLAPQARPLPAAVQIDRAFMRWAEDPAGVDAPARLVLRLDEPAADDLDAWPLALFLEQSSEPDVLLPASEVCAEAQRYEGQGGLPLPAVGGAAEAGRALAALQQALGRAAAVFPALAVSDPPAQQRDEFRLTAQQAWELLSQGRARLESAGIRLVVPSWWAAAPRPKARLRLEASGGGGMFGASQLVRFDWRVALGDQTLAPEDFEQLVARRTPLVRLQTGWAVLPPAVAEALVARWRSGPVRGEVGAGTALLMALQAEAETPAGAAVRATPFGGARRQAELPEAAEVEVEADAQVLGHLRGLAEQPPELPEPEGFVGTLRPYQRRGLAWLATRAGLGLGGVLADDMGLGKTVQLLALLAHRRAAGARGPVLIVAPTSVVANWAAEARRFLPGYSVLSHHGAARARGQDLQEAAAGVDLVLTSYALLLRDGDLLAGIPWDGVVLDEAQNVKNASAKQAQAARRLPGRYRFALTGTPVENALSDLWSIFAFVQPGYLGSAEVFRRRLAGPIERGHDEDAAATLRKLVGPLVLRRSKREPGVADDLPERIETLERCALTREQAALYEAVTRQLLERIEESRGMERRAAVLLALLRLKQICNHPAHYSGDGRELEGGSGKLERLEELLDEVVAEGDRALVFTQFAAWGRRLEPYLRQRLGKRAAVLRLDGSTTVPERARLVQDFQTGAGPAVFVLSLKAGGAGLNLTAARHVFHYDRWWNPAVEQQATDRAHRIGQTSTVQVHKLLCPGTLEERIDQLMREKGALAEGVFGASGEAWLTELDDRALRDVLTLRRAALQS